MWRILNAENKILKHVQILAARKNQWIEKSLLLLKIRRVPGRLFFAAQQRIAVT
jgi:hypothetical protein